MSDIGSIVLGGLSGVIIYVIGQLLSKFMIEPLQELRKVVGEVRFNLSFHAPTIHTPNSRSKETSEAARLALMKSSCDLVSKLHAVPAFGVLRWLPCGVLPNRKDIENAAIHLRGLSTYVHEDGDKAYSNIDNVNNRVSEIESLLCLNPLELWLNHLK
jgi:hypothetical protein